MLWVFLVVAAVGLVMLGYRRPRRRRWLLPRRLFPAAPVSASVDRQHKHLLAGGQLGEAAVAATEARFRALFEAGRVADVEREVRAGIDFAVQVHALTSIGTREAGRVLEKQLARTHTRDQVEQTWYWADVASALRRLGYAPALPAVLRCADAAAAFPAGTVLAAEAVAFPNFSAALVDPTGSVGRAALRAVVRVARGCRGGVIDPGGLLQVGLGDILAAVSETAPPAPDPWLAAALLEAERVFRRIGHWARLLHPDVAQLAERQGMRLWSSASRRTDWLLGAPDRLLARFPVASADEQGAILRCLFEFRTDVTRLFPHLPNPRVPWWAEAIRCLTWSRSSVAGAVLASHANRWLNARRGRRRAAVLLAALRGHPGPEAESVLLRAIATTDPQLCTAAALALGWWPPIDTASVTAALRGLRASRDLATRRAAVGALARLGDRSALAEVSGGLSAEEPAIRSASALLIADAELSWLWLELQDAADSPEPETAFAATEALERLREHLLGPLG
jgi:hypothetical protein